MAYRRKDRTNTYHLVMDVAWYGIAVAATSRFLGIYAIHMEASPTQLTLLTALPALALLITSLLSTRWRQRFSSSLGAVILPSIAFRFSFLLPAFTPFFPAEYQIPWLIASVALPALPQGIAWVVFWGVFRETLDEGQIKPVFGWRMAALNLTLGMAVLFFGFCLEYLAYPLNYQVIFLCAFAASMMSIWHLSRLKIEPNLLARAAPPTAALLPAGIWQNRAFWDVAWLTFITHMAFFAVFPLVPLWLADDLGVSDRFLVQFGIVELYAGAIISMLMPRLIARLRGESLVALAMLMTALALLVIVYAPVAAVTFIGAILIGVGWTLVSLGLQALFMNATPPEQTTAYATLFQQIMFLSVALAPFVGNIMAASDLDLGVVLLMGMTLRLVAAIAVWLASKQRTTRRKRLVRIGR